MLLDKKRSSLIGVLFHSYLFSGESRSQRAQKKMEIVRLKKIEVLARCIS
ncbi:hypothetical protein [Motiliproteus sp. MSK22-1]